MWRYHNVRSRAFRKDPKFALRKANLALHPFKVCEATPDLSAKNRIHYSRPQWSKIFRDEHDFYSALEFSCITDCVGECIQVWTTNFVQIRRRNCVTVAVCLI